MQGLPMLGMPQSGIPSYSMKYGKTALADMACITKSEVDANCNKVPIKVWFSLPCLPALGRPEPGTAEF